MANVNVNVTETRRMSAGQLTIGDYLDLFEGLPRDIVVNSNQSQGDRPWESGTTTVSVNVPRKTSRTTEWQR